ncbi:phosphoenolpyruvate--protein phosphotransferase [Sanguibacter antarcticus]|uniref:Phosphoenolpyruvate-protein phosphotransferase n=1 Tax=Sanguibacter antarcticus TaxID=372484 RepID=A0A2A9E9A4_9MICO|nr:phosphoenolpyruvate--protein phosphotransferase [Sanguibacter antarcticus]PFG34812.1 phosphoenolpyruvate--protein phosphotransferase [Sanguibacter antarcticus]
MTTRAGARTLVGVGVGRRAVIGPVVLVRSPAPAPGDAPVLRDGTPVSAGALPGVVADAFAHVHADLADRAARASGSVANVLTATAQIASDPALIAGVQQKIAEGTAPVAAVHAVVDVFVDMFESAGGLLAERVIDLHSVRDRVIAAVLGLPAPGVPELTVPAVVVARDLAPADTAALDLDKVLAIVTELGGPTSHTAIIAGQLGWPCVVQVAGAGDLPDGATVLVDAQSGTIVVDPDPAAVAAVADRAAAEEILAHDNAPATTADGHGVDLLANIGTVADADLAAARTDARTVAGSGLFRTEVLFLNAQQAPTVEEQRREYAAALAAFGDRKVVVRTLDAGADKPLAFATLPDEENPALGVRGYRVRRVHPHLLSDQLTALADAAGEGGTQPWVMAPMIATVAEARAFAADARAAGIGTVGIMIEVPAAALRARDLLHEVDFVSIGTNDLAQYTMATDRLRGELADLLDPWQPAVLELVAQTARAGRELGKPVGVCGESAADPLMALVLVGLGVTSLSMSSGAVPAVRFALRQHTLEQCQAMARAALGADDPSRARRGVVELLEPRAVQLLS